MKEYRAWRKWQMEKNITLDAWGKRTSLQKPSEKVPEQLKPVLNTEWVLHNQKHQAATSCEPVGRRVRAMGQSIILSWRGEKPGFDCEQTQASPRDCSRVLCSLLIAPPPPCPPLTSFQNWWAMEVRPYPRAASVQTSQKLRHSLRDHSNWLAWKPFLSHWST